MHSPVPQPSPSPISDPKHHRQLLLFGNRCHIQLLSIVNQRMLTTNLHNFGKHCSLGKVSELLRLSGGYVMSSWAWRLYFLSGAERHLPAASLFSLVPG